MRRAGGAAGLAAIALVVAACGGTSKEDYEHEIDQIGRTLDDRFTQVGRDIQTSGGLENAADDVEEGADAYEDVAADLREIDAPDDAERAHAKIVQGVESIADDFHAAARAAGSNRAARVHELLGSFQSSEGYRKIIEGREDLKDAGYAVEAAPR